MKRAAIVAVLVVASACRIRAEAPQQQSFLSDGVRIAYTDDGSGDPVVLIHGLGSNADRNWRMPGTIALLAQHRRVIALDLRGHGQSDRPNGEAAYGVKMVDDVVRLLDHLHIERADIVGYSMGGMVALKFAVDHPDRTRSLLLGGMGWMPEPSIVQQYWRRAESPIARSLATLALTADQVKSVRAPAEIVVGERDAARQMYVAPLERIRPDWPVVVVPGVNHLRCVVAPEFKEALLRWLAR